MTGFLLTISFLLHAITLLAVYALAKRPSIKNNDVTSQKEEIIELFEHYLANIKEENNKLQRDIQPVSSSTSNETSESPNTWHPLDHLPVEKQVDELETSFQAKVLQLHNQGLSSEEIASKLGCGKTEVELIIKFNK